MSVLDHAAGYPLDTEEHAAGILAGGIANSGYQCGMLWGMTLAAGAQAYRVYGAGPGAEYGAVLTAQKMVASFRGCNKPHEINCMEILGMNFNENMTPGKAVKYIFTGKLGGVMRCLTIMAGKSAKAGFKDINEILPEIHYGNQPGPVSCAAVLARKMGASEAQAVMAAGLAGGIGFSGGGCGALGTAIWLKEMEHTRAKPGERLDYGQSGQIINRFLKTADFQYECVEITGRKFQDAKEHAAFLRGGGCSKIIEALAAVG
jgi:hypothetical protein